MPSPLVDTLRTLIGPPTESAGYELVDVAWLRDQSGWVVRVMIDSPDGVSHADCERVSREVSAVLDAHDVIDRAYSLEVSSPGLNRPLRSADHFRRFLGDRARVRLRAGIEGRHNFAGRIVGVTDDSRAVVLDVDGVELALPIEDIEKANREHEFGKK